MTFSCKKILLHAHIYNIHIWSLPLIPRWVGSSANSYSTASWVNYTCIQRMRMPTPLARRPSLSHILYAPALPPVLCNCLILGKWIECRVFVCDCERGQRQPSRCSVFSYGELFDESCNVSCISRVRVWQLHNARLRDWIFQRMTTTITWLSLVCW